jgi:LDH2 family malate/lactate/ureidoglycolate dehydrogenase
VLDIKRFAEPTAFKRQVDAVIRQLHGSALLPGFDRIRLPGEDRAQRIAERTKNGIPIPGGARQDGRRIGDREAVGVTPRPPLPGASRDPCVSRLRPSDHRETLG